MKITTEMIKQLRKMTDNGYSLMDCKKALHHSNGNKEKAKQILRKSSPLLIRI